MPISIGNSSAAKPLMSPPNWHQFALAPGIVADARRVLWLETHRTLVVADLHLGYVWIERQRGTLLPIVPDDSLLRLAELQEDYGPERWVFLGDTVHGVGCDDVAERELAALFVTLQDVPRIDFVIGNHDLRLAERTRWLHLPASVSFAPLVQVGPHVLVHGDRHDWTDLEGKLGEGGLVFYGHEHPAIQLGDGVATSVKVPSFLIGERRLILPAFSRWAAGQVFGRHAPLSRLSTPDSFGRAIAILGDRVMPVERSLQNACCQPLGAR